MTKRMHFDLLNGVWDYMWDYMYTMCEKQRIALSVANERLKIIVTKSKI